MAMFRRINPTMVYMVHRLQVVQAFAIGIRFDDLEYLVVPDLRSGQATAMTAENVFFAEHEARERCIKFLKMRLMVEETRYDRARVDAGYDSEITDVDYREIAPVAG